MPTKDDLLREIRRVLGDDVYEQAVAQMGEDKLIEAVLTQAAQASSGTTSSSASAEGPWLNAWQWVAAILNFLIVYWWIPWLLFSISPTVGGSVLGLLIVAWIITGIGTLLESSDITADSVLEPVGVGLMWLVMIALIGGAVYGIYRGAPYVWSSTVAWWQWLGSHIGG